VGPWRIKKQHFFRRDGGPGVGGGAERIQPPGESYRAAQKIHKHQPINKLGRAGPRLGLARGGDGLVLLVLV